MVQRKKTTKISSEERWEKERKRQLRTMGISIGLLMLALLIILVMFIVVASWLGTQTASQENITNVQESSVMRIGTCPSMAPFVDELALDSIEHIAYSSTAEALHALSKGNINGAIVGRLAFTHEIPPYITEHNLREGYTLVSHSRMNLPYPIPSHIVIHTALSPEEAEMIIPSHPFILHETNAQAYSSLSRDEVMLIDWVDFSDKYELVIVSFPDGTKPYQFRLPTLYSNDINSEIIEQLSVIADYCCVRT